MRLLIFSFFFLLINVNIAFSQTDEEVKKQMEKIEKEIQKKEKEYIENFVGTLEIDDFQKEIIKQKMLAYFDAKKAIYIENPQYFKRDELVEQLDATHFLDIKDMVTEDTMIKIMESVKGTASKKNKKKRNKKND